MRTSEILNRAADLIEQRGWDRGSGWPSLQNDKRPLCLEGGILAAMGLTYEEHVQDERYYGEVVTKCPAFMAVRRYLRLADDYPLWQWNDRWSMGEDGRQTRARTREEVLSVLRAAAITEELRENTEENAQ